MAPAAIKASEIGEVVWVSLAASIGVTMLFSLVVLASARSAECRRTGRDGAATAYAGGALAAFLLFAAIVVLGVKVLLTK